MFSAIFAGVASLAGAVLTRRDAKKEAARVAAANRAEAARIQKANAAAAAKAQKQNTQVRQNYYKNVVSDAQAAGINPLTALRTGGGAGYGTAVAGTMYNPVMMEGVYEAPTLSRNPLAAGLEAATNTYLSELTRQKQYTHESRMDELQRSLMRAQIKGMTSELTRSDEEVFLFNQDGTHMVDEMGNKIKVDPTGQEAIPKFRLVYDQATKQTYAILNLEITEAGPTEMATGVAMDAGASSAHGLGVGFEMSVGGYKVGIPVNPFGLSRNEQGFSLGWGMQR